MLVLVPFELFVILQVVTRNLLSIRCWVRSWGRGKTKGPAPLSWNTGIGCLEGSCKCVEAVSLIPQTEDRSLEAPETQPPGLLPIRVCF